MTIFNKKDPIWFERYKPQAIEDLILPPELKNSLKYHVAHETVPNFGLFSNSPGTGKSSTVNAILKAINGEALWINASMESGIDVLRGKITNFASQQSFDDKQKIVVLDEADHMSSNAQAAFRGFIDEFSENCSFIFTGNFKEKIIQPLLDRLEIYNYDEFKKTEMARPILERLIFILDTEEKEYKKEDLVSIINTFYPSIRSMVGALQKYSTTGTLVIPEGELDNLDKFTKLMETIKTKSFNAMIEAVNDISAPSSFYPWLYKNLHKFFEKENLPKAVLSLAKFQDMDSRAVDKNLNTAACCTEIMSQCQIK
jgi:replication factor C small subunit